MSIIRITRKQIEAANKAREAALKKDEDFRRHEEQRQRFQDAIMARESSLEERDDSGQHEEQCQSSEDVAKAHKVISRKKLKAAGNPKGEEPS
jgi:molecular chaperone DnaK (HSP70)